MRQYSASSLENVPGLPAFRATEFRIALEMLFIAVFTVMHSWEFAQMLLGNIFMILPDKHKFF